MNQAKKFTELVAAANIQFPGFGITEIIIGYEGFEDQDEVATTSMYDLPTEVREWIKTQVKIHTALKAKTIEVLTVLGFDFSQFDNGSELSEIKERAIEFLQAHLSELEQNSDECEVHGNGSRQSVNYDDSYLYAYAAADAADAAADKYLLISANICLEALKELKSPGVEFLYLCD